jgi:predicted CoA-binding protein
MKTVVLGASDNPARYSYLAVQSLKQYQHEVVAIGRRAKKVDDWEILEGKPPVKDVHTVTLYLSAKNQEAYMDYIIGLKPERVIFNPGAENDAFAKKLAEHNINAEQACTLVLLNTHQY